MFNSRLKKELQQLRDEFEQYKYDQSNLPKFKEGQVLEDGSIVTKVEKILLPISLLGGEQIKQQEYYWSYKVLKKGKIININK